MEKRRPGLSTQMLGGSRVNRLGRVGINAVLRYARLHDLCRDRHPPAFLLAQTPAETDTG
jgi:hypothetical protein